MAKILVVDDDVSILRAVGRTLRTLGHEVISAENGEEALEKIVSDPTIELILSDYDMPGISGLELYRSIRLGRPELPFIFMTGKLPFPDELRETGREILKKPFDLEELALAIEKSLGP